MPGKVNPLRRMLSALPRAAPPLRGIEVRDSTWDEWNSVLQAEEDRGAGSVAKAEPPAGDKPERSRRKGLGRPGS